MMILMISVFALMLAENTAQSTIEIVGSSEKLVYGSKYILGIIGENMTMTCRSDLESVTLEYSSVVYNNTKNNSGVYTVSFTKVATKSDNMKTVKCRAVNATGFQLEKSAYISTSAEAINLTIGGVGEFGEGDTTNISCTISGSRFLPSNMGMIFFKAGSSSNINQILTNTSLYKRIDNFDNVTGTYTSVLRVPPVLVDSSLNQGVVVCNGNLNGSLYNGDQKFTVFYGPKENYVNLYGTQTAREGNSGKWTCESNVGNPVVTFTWYNGSTTFIPGTPVLMSKPTTGYVSQEWNFKYSRDFSGCNITCVVTGYKNSTVTKTRQFGEIEFAPELAIRGEHVVDEGDTVNLTCEVVAASPMTVAKWTHQVNNDRLLIPNVQSKANGNLYTCSATNSVDNAYLNIRLNIQYGPRFNLDPSIWVKEGSNISIPTGTLSNPAPVMSWRKTGNDSILSSDKTLFLTSVTREQAGVYIFKATSHRLRKNNRTEEFTKNATVVLQVRYGPGDSLTLSPSLKNQTLTVESGETIPQITCKADCVPNCEFRWTQYIRKSQMHRSSNAVLDLGNASSSKVGLYVCEATNYVGAEKFTENIRFQLHVRYKPEIQSVSVNNYKSQYREGSPISITATIRAFPAAWVKWGFQNPLNINQFMPLDSRYNVSRSVNCSYDCVITEVLTLNQPLCTDSRNKYSLFAGNEKGNSSIRTTHYYILVTCEPRLANVSLTNQTYRTCEGAELNMTVTYVAIPGPFIAWYLLPNTNRYVHFHEGRGAGYSKTYHTSTYRIPYMTRYKFGTYVVEGDYSRKSPDSTAYIRVVRDPSCVVTGSTDLSTSTISPTSATSRNKGSRQKGSKGGAIAGAVIGSLLLVALIVVGILLFLRYRGKMNGNIKFEEFDRVSFKNS